MFPILGEATASSPSNAAKIQTAATTTFWKGPRLLFEDSGDGTHDTAEAGESRGAEANCCEIVFAQTD